MIFFKGNQPADVSVPIGLEEMQKHIKRSKHKPNSTGKITHCIQVIWIFQTKWFFEGNNQHVFVPKGLEKLQNTSYTLNHNQPRHIIGK